MAARIDKIVISELAATDPRAVFANEQFLPPLACCCLKKIFLGCAPVLLKITPKTGDVGELLPTANYVIRPPPPIPPLPRND